MNSMMKRLALGLIAPLGCVFAHAQTTCSAVAKHDPRWQQIDAQ
jgi:hypothetical protein